MTGRYGDGDPVPLLGPGRGRHGRAHGPITPDGLPEAGVRALGMLSEAAYGSRPGPPPTAVQEPDPRTPPEPRRSRSRRARLARVGLVVITGVALCAGLVAVSPALRHWPGAPASWLPHAWAARSPWLIAVIAAAAAGAGAATALILLLVRAARRGLRGQQLEDVLTVVVAVIGSATALQGMWEFFGGVLHMDVYLRLLLFGFIDGSTVVEALRARRNMREVGSTGIDGIAMWVLTTLSGVLASLAAASPAAGLFRLCAPEVAAWLWDRGLRLERRRRTGRKIHWRWTPERILVQLGAAEATGQTTDEAEAQRRINILARHVTRFEHLRTAQVAGSRLARAGKQIDRALGGAVEHAGLADDVKLQEQLARQIAVRLGRDTLIGLRQAPPWAPAGPGGGNKDTTVNGPPPPPPPPNRRRRRFRRPRGQGAGGAPGWATLADDIAEARADGEHVRAHELFSSCPDYGDFVRWLAAEGRPKRVMALTALYALGDLGARAEVVQWIAEQVQGPAGTVDKKTIREAAQEVRAFQAAAGPGEGDRGGPERVDEERP